MFERSALVSLATALLLVLAAPAIRANPAPLDHPEEEQDEGKDKAGGNAIDRAAAGGATEYDEPDDYEIAAYFWAFALGIDPEDLEDSEFDTLEEELAYQLSTSGRLWRGEPLVVVGSIRTSEPLTPAPAAAPAPAALPEQPIDGPAESILDQIDERQEQLPMVGELGTTSAATVPARQTETPPPESILDYLDSAPPPPPAAQDPAKPAVNQAAAPPVRSASQEATP
jgi:hypothetical protein